MLLHQLLQLIPVEVQVVLNLVLILWMNHFLSIDELKNFVLDKKDSFVPFLSHLQNTSSHSLVLSSLSLPFLALKLSSQSQEFFFKTAPKVFSWEA